MNTTISFVVLGLVSAGAAQDVQRGLDARIDGSRITEGAAPAVVNRVVSPQPAVFLIADDAQRLPIDEAQFVKGRTAIDRGLEALKLLQHDSGGWLVGYGVAGTDMDELSPVSVAVTALAVKAFAQRDAKAMESDHVRRAVAYVLRARKQDGSYEGGALTNYVTSAVVSALASLPADDDPELSVLRDRMRAGAAWLQEAQWDEGEGLNARQDWYGGAGYGGHGRPDLSNTQMMLDALYDAGLSPDEPAFQRAQAFLTRTQNLKTTNPSSWAGDDGGFVYTPANGGESMASEAAGEGRTGDKVAPGTARGLRSYGSMTYAGFKSMIYAGLSADDVRVRAAFDWVRKHWTFDENPGMGQQGLYYYYVTMARALRAAQQHEVVDDAGTAHNWRAELIDAVVKRQRADGTWVNDADRWMEGLPEMATIDAVLALEESLKPVPGEGVEQ